VPGARVSVTWHAQQALERKPFRITLGLYLLTLRGFVCLLAAL
jgi:hypothetical protein